MTGFSKAIASILFGAGLALSANASPAAAQDATYLPPEAGFCDMYRGLSRLVPEVCAQPGDRAVEAPGELKTRGIRPTRGIRFHNESAVSAVPAYEGAVPAYEGAVQQTAAVEQQDPPKDLAIAMQVQFEFDSFRLTEQAKRTLDKVAGVLQDDLMRDKVIRLEGHTDAHGPAEYNLNLSQLRARSVRAYLIEQHGIQPDRLPFVGLGKSKPYDPSDPFNGINRRVEFHNLTG